MDRNPIERLGNLIGMYAYLAAIGGLEYWPALRRRGVQDIAAPEKLVEEERTSDVLLDTVSYERDRSGEEVVA